MKTQRPLIAILLVVVFAFNMLGYCVFSLLVVTHKKVVFNRILSGQINQQELCSLKASNISKAVWENDDEFEWNGEMYDVVQQEYLNGDVIYTCKKDIQEDELIAQKRKAEERSAGSKMIKMTKIFVQSMNHHPISFLLIGHPIFYTKISNNYSYSYFSIALPPPKA